MHWVLDMPGGLVMVRGVFDRVLESGAKDLPGKTMQRGKRRIKVLKFSWKTRDLSERSDLEYSTVFLPPISNSHGLLPAEGEARIEKVTGCPGDSASSWEHLRYRIQPSSGLGTGWEGRRSRLQRTLGRNGHWQLCHLWASMVTGGSWGVWGRTVERRNQENTV